MTTSLGVSKTLSQDEIDANARQFSKRWKNEKNEKSEAQTFVNEFFAVFGLDRKSVANLEEHPDDSAGFMDCLWKGKIMIEMKSLGENLDKAMDQALGYYVQLKKDEEPRYILACDFEHWYLLDKKEKTDHIFTLSDLVVNIGLFGFMTNRPKTIQADPVNLHASEILGKIFDMLKASGYGTHHAEYFLTRIVFCLFADDTGIFGDHGRFQSYIKNSTQEDGSDLGHSLAYLFGVLNQDVESRSKTMGPKIRSFPYINGALFEKPIEFPDFNSKMRELLIQAGDYDWSKVSPAIFGNMFQTVMDQDARREMGAHYTSEENILKVIRPLFLDNLNEEYDEINKIMDDTQKDRYIEFQNKLADLKFFDPACGSGNFLVVAYREIRRLEHRVIMKIYGYEGNRIDTDELSKVNVDQFYGIEIIEFSSRIAETSLWMMDHIMNVELSDRYGYRFRRIPIKKKPTIVHRDALEFDWNELLPSAECNYILGNPPFGGIRELTSEQNEQLVRIANLENHRGMLDYVSAWFIKASEYVNDKTQIGFVATDSIVQGIQVDQLWPILFERNKIDISFAYKSFLWSSEARDQANVSVVIIGLAKKFNGKKYIFSKNERYEVENITPYLKESSKSSMTVVKREKSPINGFPDILIKGMAITDDDNYVFEWREKNNLIRKYNELKSYFRPYITAKGLLHDQKKWVLLVYDIPSNLLSNMDDIKELIANVRKFRKQSKKKETQKLGDSPKQFERPIIPDGDFLAIPVVSSEKREYIPIDILSPPNIASASIIIGRSKKIDIALFAILSSKMHMLWLEHVGGKLESRLRYSNIVYNTFPIPNDYSNLASNGNEILQIRKQNSGTLAQLYDKDGMPVNLKKAHLKLDKKLEQLYRKKPFESDAERLEFLLEQYQKMTSKQTTLYS